MPDRTPDDMVLVRRNDLREVIERHEDSEAYAIVRLRAVVNGEAATVEPTDAIVDRAVRAFNGWPADHPMDHLHRLDDRWIAMRDALRAVGPWTTQETP